MPALAPPRSLGATRRRAPVAPRLFGTGSSHQAAATGNSTPTAMAAGRVGSRLPASWPKQPSRSERAVVMPAAQYA
ncbi:hypothetical protein ACGFYM_33615 [Streptomyces sp. NPDC048231]|uniref:hypothetical protein n=1 Tax=Streptomyces sp. NPDC048231 TaxID=3365519 RepID=UPI0037184B65